MFVHVSHHHASFLVCNTILNFFLPIQKLFLISHLLLVFYVCCLILVVLINFLLCFSLVWQFQSSYVFFLSINFFFCYFFLIVLLIILFSSCLFHLFLLLLLSFFQFVILIFLKFTNSFTNYPSKQIGCGQLNISAI